MFKITVAFLLIAAVYLFWPRFDLYERDGSWSERFVLREQGFWRFENCQNAGRHFDNPYKCYKTTTWQGLWGRQLEIKH